MRIVELFRGGRSAPSISADFEVSEATIYRWVLQDRIDHGEMPGPTSTENAQLKSARARIRELETDLEIEVFYNRQRRHGSLEMLTPDEYETPQTPTLIAA